MADSFKVSVVSEAHFCTPTYFIFVTTNMNRPNVTALIYHELSIQRKLIYPFSPR